MTFEFTLLTSRSCKAYRDILTDGDRWPVRTEVEEKLGMRGVEGLDELVGSSVFNSHYYWDINAVVGVIETGAVEGEELVCRARFSRRDDVKPELRFTDDQLRECVTAGLTPPQAAQRLGVSRNQVRLPAAPLGVTLADSERSRPRNPAPRRLHMGKSPEHHLARYRVRLRPARPEKGLRSP
ncbi:hypothetical protein CYD53_108139 [Bosea psychrotolerans]|uniref:Uncharacterized protein n=2 Tax=Bosea psychrotolerans TaxID=1871628 RepID=A0A2S4M8B2_9HYPH|nr:hypothetical protein CYD53_108139 [Bosea psychrotolerans]